MLKRIFSRKAEFHVFVKNCLFVGRWIDLQDKKKKETFQIDKSALLKHIFTFKNRLEQKFVMGTFVHTIQCTLYIVQTGYLTFKLICVRVAYNKI